MLLAIQRYKNFLSQRHLADHAGRVMRLIKQNGIVDTLWFTADMHYGNPDKAKFQDRRRHRFA